MINKPRVPKSTQREKMNFLNKKNKTLHYIIKFVNMPFFEYYKIKNIQCKNISQTKNLNTPKKFAQPKSMEIEDFASLILLIIKVAITFA